MTSDLCEEDVVRISSPQILTTNTLVSPVVGTRIDAGVPAGVAASTSRVQASSAAVELGRRLLLAARAGDTATVLDLMAKGAPFTTDWLGTSPLHLAAANAHAETCAVLLRAGVSRDSRTKVERTPLHLAAHAGHADVVALLLDHGAIVDCRDMLRMTPLHWAAARGHEEAARELLRRGADARARCKFRHTPRSLAARHQHRRLVALLDRAETEACANAITEQMAEETRKALEVDGLTSNAEIKMEKPKPKLQQETVKQPKPEPQVEQQQQQQAAQLLRKHGITLLPTDDGSTVLNAIQSGRTVVLSDAGKLMLKESGCTIPSPGASGAGGPGGAGSGGKGVVLTATPVRSPPQGVKIFTLNNKVLLPSANKIPIKKVINPHDIQQMKFVQLSSESKVLTPVKGVTGAGVAGGVRGKPRLKGRPAVKIIVNKTNLNKLINTSAVTPLAAASAPSNGHDVGFMDFNKLETSDGGVRVLSQMESQSQADASGGGGAGDADEARQLRAQLAVAHAALADVTAELRACKERLRAYEEP